MSIINSFVTVDPVSDGRIWLI